VPVVGVEAEVQEGAEAEVVEAEVVVEVEVAQQLLFLQGESMFVQIVRL
jgi:hypothetical protein